MTTTETPGHRAETASRSRLAACAPDLSASVPWWCSFVESMAAATFAPTALRRTS